MPQRRGKSRVGEDLIFNVYMSAPRGVVSKENCTLAPLQPRKGEGDQSASTTRTFPFIDWLPSTKLVVRGGVWSLAGGTTRQRRHPETEARGRVLGSKWKGQA